MKLSAIGFIFLGLSGLSYGSGEKWITISEGLYQKSYDYMEANKGFMSHPLAGKKAEFVSKQGIQIVKMDDEQMNALSGANHMITATCPGFVRHDSYEEAMKWANFDAAKAENSTKVKYRKSSAQTNKVIRDLISAVSSGSVSSMNSTLENMGTRHHQVKSGSSVSGTIGRTWQSLLSGRSDVTVRNVNHRGTQQNSVILEIRGSERPDKIMVLGGHLDSINRSNNNNAPGADDDASGIASLTGIISAIGSTNFRPKISLHFMGYAAEEIGLVGSKEIVSSYSGKNVVAVMQFDMTGYKNGPAAIITDYTNSTLNQTIRSVNNAHQSAIGLGTLASSACNYGCSDHASWTNAGFPAAFPTETRFGSHNKSIHTSNDTSSKLNVAWMTSFAKLGAAMVAKVSEDSYLVNEAK